ncbi:MFS transporter [Austwickia chelonae]|uniref:MFS transporter n=1 Tax=Austwickia chelonae TaxID=100225 RepID=UPI000E239647|nr:MFS transporter [Austwickia chelonae]
MIKFSKANNEERTIGITSGPGPIVAGAVISAFGDALIPIAFAIECHRVEPRGWGMASVLFLLWSGRFMGVTLTRRMRPSEHPVRTMMIADLTRALAQLGLLAALAFTTISGSFQTVAAMSISSFIYGLAAAFFAPARFISLSKLSSGGRLNQVNSILSMVGDVSAILGPIIGSLAVVWLGFDRVLLLDGISFLIAFVLLLPLKSLRVVNDQDDSPEETVTPGHQTRMPQWFMSGLVAWGVLTVTIGVLGVAGPTEALSKFGVTGWATVSVFLGVGSLLASTTTLLGISGSTKWRVLLVVTASLMALQVVAFIAAPNVWILVVAGLAGSMAVTLSGIRWDTMGQSLRTPWSVHEFATLDQLVTTTAIPLGMVLYGVAGFFDATASLLWILALMCSGIAFWSLFASQPSSSDFRSDHELPV